MSDFLWGINEMGPSLINKLIKGGKIMRSIRRGVSLALIVVSFLVFFAEYSVAATLLPWVRFVGTYQATAGIGTGVLTLNAFVNEMDYENGDIWTANVAGVESIHGAKVVLSGATRTGSYSFNGDPNDPDDVRFKIVSSDGFIYFDANLADSVFTQSGLFFVWLNQGLNANDPSTLNLNNIVLNTDASHPSRYIQELAAYLSSSNVSGLKMQLRVPLSGNFTTNASGTITYGLIDGLQSLNSPPVADAGENLTISSEAISVTTIQGTATDFDGDFLQCRWTAGAAVLKDWFAAGTGGECSLDLNTLLFSQAGTYTLTLEVNDGQVISSDDMILTIDNSAPHGAPGGGGIFEINTDVILTGDVSDFDGDLLYYEWSEGTTVLCSGNIQAIAEGTPVILPDCIVSGLSLGIHVFTLSVDDGLNSPDSNDVTVEIVDTTVPTLAPIASSYLLWPPNHIMVDIAVAANAYDNSGLPVMLSATITSNEPEDGLGDGDTGPDWTQPVIDQNTGMIYFQLRRERSGSGNGRVYTITITATDSSGNSSTTAVNIGVPHDKRKK